MRFSALACGAALVAVVVAEEESAVVGSFDSQLESNRPTHAASPAMRMRCAWETIIATTSARSRTLALTPPSRPVFDRRPTNSHRPASGPRRRGDRERPVTETFASHRLDTCAAIAIESLNVVAGRSDTVCVRLPPLLKGWMHNIDRYGFFFHVAKASSFE